MNSLSKLGLVVLFSFSAGCGRKIANSSDDDRERTRIESKIEAQSNDPFRRVNDYIANACYGSLDGGDPAPYALPAARSQIAYFQKPYDPSRLETVGRLSPRATIDVITSDGANVFAAPLRAGTCALFAVLPEVRDDLWSIWSPANVGIGRTLLGLFLPLSRVAPSGYTKPVIVVREDTDRYTLVHEYMHFVFDRARHAAGQGDVDWYAEARLRLARLKTLLPYTTADESNPDRTGALVDAWSDLAEALITVTDQFPLEEMAVEALLGDAYRAGKLTNVPEMGRRNGDAYILANWTTENTGGKAVLLAILSDAEDRKTMSQRFSFTDRYNRVVRIQQTAIQRLEEGNGIASRAEASKKPSTIGSGVIASRAQIIESHRQIDFSKILPPKF